MTFEGLASPAELGAILMACALAALIPAFVIKVLMGTFFFKTVSYLLVLLALIVSTFISVVAYSAFGLLTDASIDALNPVPTLLLLGGGLILQTLCLKFIAPGPRMEWIAAWKWLVVIVLQYVVYILLALLYALVVGVPSEAASNAANL